MIHGRAVTGGISPWNGSKFDQLAAGLSGTEQPATRLTRAEYVGTLENDVLRGTGTWTIKVNGKEAMIDLRRRRWQSSILKTPAIQRRMWRKRH